MNFFESQAQARRQTRWLVLLFAFAVIGIVLAVDTLVLVLFGGIGGEQSPPLTDLAPTLAFASLATLGLIGLSTLYKTVRLRSGGGPRVAESMGATRLADNPQDLKLQRLRNVVEEMSIASGMPMPAIYIMEHEAGINAFAAGYGPSDAVVAVTRGALDQLERDELQGVIAHEYSHMLNGDMRLNVRLMGVLFGILVLAVVGRQLLRGGHSSKRGNQAAMLGLGLIVVGYIGVFFGRWIKAGVSRQREYLADASAVQFTRQTSGLAGALKKIAGIDDGSHLESPDTEEVSHMLFANGLHSRMFATHPPIEQRIQRLDPHFEPARSAAVRARGVADRAAAETPAGMAGFAVGAGAVATNISALAGDLAPARVQQATQVRDNLPERLRDAARDPAQAPPLVMALLLSDDTKTLTAQLALIATDWDGPLCLHTQELKAQARALQPHHTLPLVAISLPALRHRPPEALARLQKTVRGLIHADGVVTVIEYALGAMLASQLGEALRPAGAAGLSTLRLSEVESEIEMVLAVFAEIGHPHSAQDAALAFQSGLNAVLPRLARAYRPPQRWHEILDRALLRLDRLLPLAKAQLLDAIVVTLRHDGRITNEEYELLRSVCASLHCPLPPMA